MDRYTKVLATILVVGVLAYLGGNFYFTHLNGLIKLKPKPAERLRSLIPSDPEGKVFTEDNRYEFIQQDKLPVAFFGTTRREFIYGSFMFDKQTGCVYQLCASQVSDNEEKAKIVWHRVAELKKMKWDVHIGAVTYNWFEKVE